MRSATALTILSLSAGLAFADTPATYFDQPTELPAQREWKTGPQDLPPINEIIARPAQDLPVYGVYLWGGEYEIAHEEIKKMGVRSIRMAGPTSEANNALLIAAKENVEVMYTVANSTERERKKGLSWNRSAYDSDEAYLSALAESYTQFLDKYGKNGSLYASSGLESPVKYIEILNEPNFQYMIPDREPRPEVEAEREALYAKVLPAMSKLIRDNPHGMPIVAFSCGGGGATSADSRFVKSVYKEGGKSLSNDYDIFSTHPYMDGAPPESFKIKRWGPISIANNIERMEKFLATQGAEKPIWFTEVGWEIGHEYGGQFEEKPSSKKEIITPELHGAFVVRLYLWSMRLGVDRVHIMHLHDTDHYNSGLMHRGSLEWRPAAYAIQNITTRMPNPKLTGAQSDGEGDSYIYEFIADHTKGDQTNMVVAWNVVGPKQVDIEVGGSNREITVYDMVGNTESVPVKNGKVQLEIGPYPLYIQTK